MLKHIVIVAIAAGTILTAGSAFATAAVRIQVGVGTPAYCYDCHHRPVWNIGYDRCDYYSIRVAHGGYFYRPYRHALYDNFRFGSHDFSHEKVIRTRR